MVVAPVIERHFAPSQSFVANVKPRRQSVIGSAVDGRVEEYLIDAGQPVSKGQDLARLRTGTIEIELDGAEAELALRQAELDELNNGSRPEEIELAEAAVHGAEAAMQYAQARLARAERLFKTSAGLSQDEFEAARAAATAAIEQFSESKSSLKLVREGPRAEQKEQAAARLEMQRQVVEGLRDRKEKYAIHAPFNGYVATELTEAGAWVQQGDPLAEVIEIDPVEVEVFVPEASIRYVQRGAQCEVTVESIAEHPFTGTVDRIVPLADARSRTFPVRILVPNPPIESAAPSESQQATESGFLVDSRHELMPGMLARVSLPTGDARTRMLVPKDALIFGGPNPVLLKVDGGKAAIVPLRTGPSLKDWIAVESLAPGALVIGDLVITRGNERTRPGQDINISEQQPPLN